MKLILVVLCACAVAIMAVPVEQAAEGVPEVVSQILDQIAKRVNGASAEQVGTVVKRLLSARQDFMSALLDPFLGILTAGEDTFGALAQGATNVAAGMVNAATGAAGQATNLAGMVPVVGPALKGLGNATAAIGAAMAGALTEAGTGLNSALHSPTNLISGVVKTGGAQTSALGR